MSNKVNRKAPTEAQKKKKDQKNERPAGDAYRIRILLSGRTSQSG